uniref:Ovule protein n=1 Tax=Ascaris lumbricoides TaxID=6252 RepID=A0A0M3I6H5_ASCLU
MLGNLHWSSYKETNFFLEVLRLAGYTKLISCPFLWVSSPPIKILLYVHIRYRFYLFFLLVLLALISLFIGVWRLMFYVLTQIMRYACTFLSSHTPSTSPLPSVYLNFSHCRSAFALRSSL